MRNFALLSSAILVLVLLCLMPSASSLGAGLAVIPERVTADAGFLAIADPAPLADEVVRVEWWVDSEGSVAYYGLFPKIADQWVCYFSNTDTASTCGPSPFFITTVNLGSVWQMKLTSVNQNGDTSNTL